MTQTNVELAAAARRPPRSSLFRLLSCIRFDEVLVLQGAPLIGASFAIGAITASNLFVLAALVAGNLCLIAHVFVLNDWSGIDGDLKDPNRALRTFAAKGVTRAEVGYLALSLLTLALLIFSLIGTTALILGLAIAGLSALYSAPGVHLKGAPLFSSALHLLGGALHFLLGYASFAVVDGRGIAISGFFALVFAAGHFTHEARDSEGDRLNHIRTNAVAFGKKQSFFVGLALFSAAYALLAMLALLGFVPFVLIFAAALYPLHLAASLRAIRTGLTYESLRQLQWCYRAICGTIGMVIIATTQLW